MNERRPLPATPRVRRAAGFFVSSISVAVSLAAPTLTVSALSAVVLALALLSPAAARAQVLGERYVSGTGGRESFALFADGRAAALRVDSAEWAGVIRAAGDLRADMERVTGTAPRLSVGGAAAGRVVLIGTIGKSPAIDALVRAGKLDVRGIAGRWETFVIQPVDRPMPGVEQALVIAGSDRRGTIFGIYDLSAQIGVSPWYWWADVPVERRAALHVAPGRHTRGEPAVRYRGIFINDEAPALSGWANATFGGFGHRFYERVFELILRLKGNYLWPAMWGSAFYADDSLNARTADLYGVVIGTSHHEPMMRAHDEWRRAGGGAWDYARNDSALRAFWRAGAGRIGGNESVVTVGMRGDGDEPMTRGTATALLERVVADQRRILGEVTGRDPATIPQVWALYKEVQDYYDAGMRVPPDVTLLFSDDNWGNIRRLPGAADRGRPGGFGVYYHFDYVGGPRNYKWINTTQVARVWEQMRLAHESGANRLWIANVGDIKPMEEPISFFLDYAWNPAAIPADSIPAWGRAWAAQQFGAPHAGEIAPVLAEYARLASQRKPELRDTATFAAAYGEAGRNAAAWSRLNREADRLRGAIDPAYGAAYDQLVLYPIRALANLDALGRAVADNRLWARQGRSSTNDLAGEARRLFLRDAELARWYNQEIAGGRWNHMMDQTHVGYTGWQEPPRNQMPRVDLIQVPAVAEMGVAIDGAGRWWPASRDGAVLTLARFGARSRSITVFNRGTVPFDLSATSAAPWLRLSVATVPVATDRKVDVEVDWSAAPAGTTRVPVTLAGAGRRVVVTVVVENPAGPAPRGFVEADGVVAIEAEHYDRAVPANGIRWMRIPELGRTLSAMTPSGATAPGQAPGGGPRLEYAIDLAKAGEVAVNAYLSPSLDFRGGEGLRYAVSIDDEAPQVVNMHADGSTRAGDANRAWERMVADNVKVAVSRHRVATPGPHVLKVWMIDPGVVLQRIVIDTGGLLPSYLGPPESYNARLAPSR